MPLPIPSLDDRRFDDLVEEAKARVATHVPELARITPGDPVHSLIDLFAWLTETILYRANLIPERQRRAFLNLLQVPLRPARPAAGVVSIDASPTSVQLPALIRSGAQLRAGKQAVTCLGDLQPTPLALRVAIKERVSAEAIAAMGLTLQDLQEQYGLRTGEQPAPFQPRELAPGRGPMTLATSLDRGYYLAFCLPRQLEASRTELLATLAGVTLNVAVAPANDLDAESVEELNARVLIWELLSLGEDGETLYLPLEVVSDSSLGGRKAGVARLRLPRNAALFHAFGTADPRFGGFRDQPPELEEGLPPGRIGFWLRLRCPEQPSLELGYLGVNAVDVVAQGLRRDVSVGVGTGQPDQALALPDAQIDAASLELDVERNGAWSRWNAVEVLSAHAADADVYRLDAAAGHVFFGDGIHGRRPAAGLAIRAAGYRHGGGRDGNLSPGSIKEIVSGGAGLKVRHEWPLAGGVDAESVEQAEQRIPQFLTHRNRAVTKRDFELIAETNPINPVARAEVFEGFIPGASLRAARDGVPGAISVFVLPPATPALGAAPRPNRALLTDVFGYLVQRVLIGTELYVLSPEFVPIAVSLLVDVRDPETEQQTLVDVQRALVDYLWALAPGGPRGQGWPMGNAVRASELGTQVGRVGGVLAVNAVSLFRRESGGWRRLGSDEAVTLARYQLPELLAVRAASGSGTPPLPSGLAQGGGGSEGARGVPVPVIPDVC